MDSKPVEIDSSIDVDDWFAEPKSENQPVGSSGIEDASIRVSSINPNNISQLHQNAASKPVSMSKTCQDVMPMESFYPHSSGTASSSSAMTPNIKTESAGQGSSLQSMPVYSREPVGNLVGQTTQTTILNQNVQPHIQSSSIQSTIQYSHHTKQEQNILSLPTELDSSQQTRSPFGSTFTATQDQHRREQWVNATISQQKHQLGLQEKHQQLPPYQQNKSTTSQQPLGLQSNILQQQQFLRGRSDMSKTQPRPPQALHILQQHEVATPQRNVQHTSHPMQFDMQKRHQPLATLLPQNGIIDQQRQLEQSQRVLPESSSASMDSTGQMNSDNWQDQAYQQLESVRDMYLPEAIKLFKRFRELCLQPHSDELTAKYERTRIFLEKTIKVLQMSRANILQFSKEKIYENLDIIPRFLNSLRSRIISVSAQQHGQKPLPPGSYSENPRPQQPQLNPKLQFHPVNLGVPNSQPNKIKAQTPLQQGSMHQLTLSRLQQNNLINSLHDGSSVGMEQRHSVRSLQQTNVSHIATMNAIDPTMGSLPSSSISLLLNSKQQPKHQMMQTQATKQPLQQPLIEQKKRLMFMPKMLNEPKPGQVIGFSSGMPQEHRSIRQHVEYDQKNLVSPLCKAGNQLQFAASQFVIPSPSTPLTPSAILVDLEKNPFGISPLSAAKTTEHTQTPEIGASPVLDQFTGPEDNQQTNTKEPSLKCLLDAVESISSRALSASVRDIGSVIYMSDRIAGPKASECRVTIGDDLAAGTSDRLQGRNLSWLCGSTSSNRLERWISPTASDLLSPPFDENYELDSSICQTPVMGSTTIPRIKKPRTEHDDELSEEIKEINQKLMETAIEVVLNSTEEAAKAGFGEGTIVKLTYSAICLGGNFNQQWASAKTSPILPVRLVVPVDYPKSSPVLLDSSPTSCSETEGTGNLSEKAKLRFGLSLRMLSQPMSLGEMARTWDVCARTVLREFAESMGGGSFSSTYGTWESCIPAA